MLARVTALGVLVRRLRVGVNGVLDAQGFLTECFGRLPALSLTQMCANSFWEAFTATVRTDGEFWREPFDGIGREPNNGTIHGPVEKSIRRCERNDTFLGRRILIYHAS